MARRCTYRQHQRLPRQAVYGGSKEMGQATYTVPKEALNGFSSACRDLLYRGFKLLDVFRQPAFELGFCFALIPRFFQARNRIALCV